MFKNKNPEQKESFFKTLISALILALLVRSFLFEPFHIPSSSMKPNLLVGDYIFVKKYSYGYSRYSFPLGFDIFEGRIWSKNPQRGDIAVFRLPINPKINYIKRIIGLPGDKIQMRGGVLYINEEKIKKISDGFFDDDNQAIRKFIETLPNNKKIEILDEKDGSSKDDTGIYEVPQGHYFAMGDNRDNSQDSRFLNHVGYINEEYLVGKATIIFFSTKNPVWQLWKLPTSIRYERIFKSLK